MQETALLAGGGIGMAASLLHGYLGDRRVVGRFAGGPPRPYRVMRAVMFLSAVYWFTAGAALIGAALWLDGNQARTVAFVVAAIFLSGALANLWALRGRHFGAPVLGAAAAFAIIGGL